MEAIALLLQTIFWPIVRISLHWFGSIRIIGKENVKGHKGGVIFAANHVYDIDPVIIPAALNPFSGLLPIHHVSRERGFYNVKGFIRYLYGGLGFKLFGARPTIPKMKDYEKMLPHHIRFLLRGKSVCIFPEGKLSSSGVLGLGHPGVAYLLWRTGCPIIPTALYGYEGITGLREFFMRKYKVVVSFGAPITSKEIFGAHADEQPTHEELIAATEIIMARIGELLPASNSRD